MKNKKLSYKAAATYAGGIYLMLFVMIWVFIFFGRSAFIPTEEIPHHRPDMELGPWMPVLGFITTYLYLFMLFALNFKIMESRIKESKKVFVAIAATLAVALIFNLVFFQIQLSMIEIDIDEWKAQAQFGTLVKDVILAVIVIFSAQIVYLSKKKQQMALEYETMKAENARSRFEALKNQLDPHFLFNTFNTLDSLIQENPERARDYLHQLSSVFRYVIPNKELTTLEDELNFTRSYNTLMQLRYEDSLIFDFDIDEHYLSYEIVPLSIQTLVENAIKHNVITANKPLTIRIATAPNDTITISNCIQHKKVPEFSGGIGLSNLAERFRLKTRKEITITNANDTFTVILPLKQAENKKP
ncbi:MAG: histidine kinase [Bacteroidales bacterium]|jgi:hypothetical protein|nr:histidine kinase [Bacteroidales bacterium]